MECYSYTLYELMNRYSLATWGSVVEDKKEINVRFQLQHNKASLPAGWKFGVEEERFKSSPAHGSFPPPSMDFRGDSFDDHQPVEMQKLNQFNKETTNHVALTCSSANSSTIICYLISRPDCPPIACSLRTASSQISKSDGIYT